MVAPTADDNDDVLLAARYGDRDDVQQFVTQFTADAVAKVHDEHGNTVLHMICANGHTGESHSLWRSRPIFFTSRTDLLNYILPIVPISLLASQNDAGSTPLHWAALNAHLPIIQKLVQFPDGPGVNLIDFKNAAGRSPLAEAENAGWDEGAKWFVEVMNLKEDAEADVGEQDAAEIAPEDIEVEIEDAEGQVASLSITKGSVAVRQQDPVEKSTS